MKYGSITTGIIADGLVFNMDPANRASTIPNTSTDKTFNTIDTSISGSFINDTIYDSSTISPSYAFDGTGDYIAVSPLTTSAPIFSSPTNFSINLAFNSINFASSSNPKLFTKGDDVGSNRALWTWDVTAKQKSGNNQVRWNVSDGSALAFNGNTTGNLSTNTWYIVCCTYAVGAGGNIYLNGVLNQSVATNTGTTPNTETGRVSIARERNGGSGQGSDFFYGNIGCVQYYNRALTANEVLHNYNALKGRFGL